MRKITAAAALAVSALGIQPLSAAAEQINFSTYIPASERAVSLGFEPMFEAVAEATGGEVTAQILTAGQMFGPFDTLPGIQNGAVAGGTVFTGFYANELPHAAFLEDTVALNSDRVAAIAAALETYFQDCPGCKEEEEKAGVVSLGGHALAPYVLICAKEVSSAEDLQGLRVRGSTGMMNSAIRLMGANGVNVSFGEISQAFERGAMDCMLGNLSWISLFGLTEIVKTAVPEPSFGIVPAPMFVTFSKDAWDGWSDEVHAAFLDYMPKYVADVTLAYLETDQQARDAAVEAGMKEVELGEAFGALRSELEAVERERIVSEARERGVGDPEALLAAYEENYAKWVELAADIDNDPEKFAAALKEEIYADLDF